MCRSFENNMIMPFLRKHFVFYNDCNFVIQQMEFGVQQGSIVGSLLFIWQMIDLTKSSKLPFAILFAEETSVLLEGKAYVFDMLDFELKKHSSVTCQQTQNKPHYMVFPRVKIKTPDTEVVMQNESIDSVTSTKFLDIIIDNKLKRNEHIAYVKNKISEAVGVLYKIRKFFNKFTLLNTYYSFVLLYLICRHVWCRRKASDSVI